MPTIRGNETLRRALRFSLTGVFVTAVHVGVALWWLRWIYPLPAIANGVAFVMATLTGFMINTRWSFKSKPTARVLLRYVLVSLIGLMVSMGLSHLAYLYGLPDVWGIALVLMVMPMINFLCHHFWTYNIESASAHE